MVKVNVRYFAMLREASGVERESVDLPEDGASLADLLAGIGGRSQALGEMLKSRPLLCAVNQEYSGPDRVLEEGDEIALFPPVSGG